MPQLAIPDGDDDAIQNGDDADALEDPAKRADLYLRKRLPVGATELPMERYQVALEHMSKMLRYSTAANQLLPSKQKAGEIDAQALGTWTGLGPGNIGGRTRALVVDPINPNTIFAAAVAGGVWKSINAGASWFATGDLMANLATCSLAMDPSNHSILYVGTGEGFNNGDAVRGNGIFKTTDAGGNWTQLAATANNSNFYYVNDIVVSPSNTQRLYAATRTGIWRSLDGGANWTRVLNPNISSGCTDLAIRTDVTGQSSDWIFGACGSFTQATVYRNTNANGAGTWDGVLTEANMGRTSLALAPSNQNTIYALADDPDTHAMHAVFRSTTGGGSGSWVARVRGTDPVPLNTYLLSSLGGGYSQGWYDNVIAVDPTNENRVWAGGVAIYRSDDGGANWGYAYNIHPDHHAIAFHPQYDGVNNKTMFVGNDGGLYRTVDATVPVCMSYPAGCNSSVTFTSLNSNYAATQFYYGLPYPDGLTYLGGTQDNGAPRGTDASGINGWHSICCGDASYVAIDPTNTNTLYVVGNQGQSNLSKSTNGGGTFNPATNGATEAFSGPLIMDPTNSQRLWDGGFMMWRTDDAANNWNQASPQLGTGFVSAIAVSPTNANNVLAGTTSGSIHRTNSGTTANSATSWPSAQPRSGFVSWVAFDPTNANIAYATYSSFNSVSTQRHVYKSTDGGASWTGIDGTAPNNLPDVPVHTVVVDPSNPQRLYVGTDVGVFSSIDGGVNWAVENSGFANVITEALSINTSSVSSKYLFAFTHGRGAWRVLLSSGCPSIINLSDQIAVPGSMVTVNGSGFLNVNSVKFSNNVSAAVNIVSDSQIIVTVPAGAVTGPITISKSGCADAQSSSITISGCPTITSLSNSIAGVGETVTINGGGFFNVSAVKFNDNVTAAFNVVSDNQITAVVPSQAVSGPITLSKANCASAQSTSLTICPTAPVTLLVDDGQRETSYGFDTGTSNSFWVNRLTPSSYPATITAVLANINLPAGTNINIVVGANPAGTSNINNTISQTNPKTVSAQNTLGYYAIPPLTINSGDFVVGYSFVPATGFFPANLDVTPPAQGRSYYSTNGTSFVSFDTFNPGNLLVRAEVFPGTCFISVPSAPVASAATSVTSTGFMANWSSTTGATGYRLDVSTSSSFGSFVSGYNDLDTGNTLSRSVASLNPNTTYYYRVRAYNAKGPSGNSNTITVTTLATPPSPTANAATDVASSSFTAKWSSSLAATGYRLDVSTSSSFASFVNGYSNLDVGNVLSRNITALVASTTYYYRLRAYNGSGTSGNSNVISITTLGPAVFVEVGTNRAAAIDSVTWLRGPFKVIDLFNFSGDHHTRLILFTSDLGLTQPDASQLTVQANGIPLTVENVAPVSGVDGMSASYIVVRLPDGLPTGDLPVVISLRGVASVNAPTITISP